MKSYEVEYTKGHLVDIKTGKRIFLKRGGRFSILGDDHQFVEKDDLKITQKALNSEEKLAALKRTYKGFHLEKIANAYQLFVYRIGLAKTTSEDKRSEFLFDAMILEDLYIRSTKAGEWVLCECLCESRICLEGEVQMIEAVQGVSLNNLFSNMVTFYFPFQRSGSCNAFDTFYFVDERKVNLFNNHKLQDLKNGMFKSLKKTRQEMIDRHRAERQASRNYV